MTLILALRTDPFEHFHVLLTTEHGHKGAKSVLPSNPLIGRERRVRGGEEYRVGARGGMGRCGNGQRERE